MHLTDIHNIIPRFFVFPNPAFQGDDALLQRDSKPEAYVVSM